MKGLAMVTLLATAGAASAETAMTEAQLDALLTGNTLYIATPGGTAPFAYGADGRASAVLPDGPTLVGTWALDGDRYCVDWENGPTNSCTILTKGPGTLAMTDAATGEPRGQVERIVPGDAEGLL